MPWTIENPPAVAKNWTKEEQRKCVIAANAVLKRGGSDKDAVFACIAAAGKSKSDNIEAYITKRLTALSMAKMQRGKKKMPKPARPPSIRGLQLSYLRDVRRIVDVLKQLTKDYIITQLPAIIERAKALLQANDRMDTIADDVEEMLSFVRIQFMKTVSDEGIVRIVIKHGEEIDENNSVYFQKLYKSLVGVNALNNEPWMREKMAMFTKQNVSLIKSIPDTYFSRIEGTITRGVMEGALASDIASDIAYEYDVAYNRAKLIARDQVSKFNSSLTEARQKDIGVKKYRWSTSGDERVRPSHAEKDGNIYSWDEPPADTGHPGQDINCRCVAIAVFEDVEEIEE